MFNLISYFMSKKLNSMPDYQARMPRFQHDISQSLAFTAAPSMLLPVYYHPLHLGDRLRFQGNLTARLNPIKKPCIGSIDLHVDYFFVPLSVIYLPALNLFYQTDDLVSSLFTESRPSSSSTPTDIYLNNSRFPVYDIDGSMNFIRTTQAGGVNGFQVFDNVDYPSSCFDCAGKAAVRLADLLDYNFSSLFVQGSYNPRSTPWFLSAYHAIYENYAGYRNSDRERKSYCYQLDKYYAIDNGGFIDSNLLCLHYVDAYKDYFNSIKVSPVGASINMLGRQSGQSDPWTLLANVDSYLFNSGGYGRSSASATTSTDDRMSTSIKSLSQTTQNQYGINAANIRQLFMVDKLLRVVGRADKNYEAQFLAHFGVKIPHDVLHNITHIGHDMFNLKPSPTISTANTFNGETGSSLGEVGGQGFVSGEGRLRHFEAPCHGIFMAIFHAVPRFRYYAGISKLHDLSSPDKWWQPEFDRRGMQPVFAYEVLRTNVSEFSQMNQRLGWQFAFEQFKRKYDKVSRAFAQTGNPSSAPSTNDYAPWVMSKTPFFKTSYNSYEPISGEAIPDIFDSTDPYNFLSFKALTTDLDGIMEVAYSTQWINSLEFDKAHTLFYTDPLIIDYRMNCKNSDFMSEYGEPELGD